MRYSAPCITATIAYALVSIQLTYAADFVQRFQVSVGVFKCSCAATSTAVMAVGKDPTKRKFMPLPIIIKDLQKKLPRSASKNQSLLRASIARFKKEQRTCYVPCVRTGAELGHPKEVADNSPTATPTATPTMTPKVTPTGIPNATPTATPTPKSDNTPTPRPTATSTATPTATPTQQGCFSATGETQCFKIPPEMSGNVTNGSKVWSSYSCSGCHTETSKRGRDYTQIVAAFNNSSMSSIPKPSSQDLAHITAYLNRYTRP